MPSTLAALRPAPFRPDRSTCPEPVARAIDELSRSLTGPGWGARRHLGLACQVLTADAQWDIEVRLLDGDCDVPAVVATVVQREPEPPPVEVLRARLGLTKQEARVARLLAAGRSNAEVADALFISPHTARHHTERVMQKLSVRSRHEVGAALRMPPGAAN
jgi:DNA-binding CsgD family transcriptional regulator